MLHPSAEVLRGSNDEPQTWKYDFSELPEGRRSNRGISLDLPR
jgi:hypothetical protein